MAKQRRHSKRRHVEDDYSATEEDNVSHATPKRRAKGSERRRASKRGDAHAGGSRRSSRSSAASGRGAPLPPKKRAGDRQSPASKRLSGRRSARGRGVDVDRGDDVRGHRSGFKPLPLIIGGVIVIAVIVIVVMSSGKQPNDENALAASTPTSTQDAGSESNAAGSTYALDDIAAIEKKLKAASDTLDQSKTIQEQHNGTVADIVAKRREALTAAQNALSACQDAITQIETTQKEAGKLSETDAVSKLDALRKDADARKSAILARIDKLKQLLSASSKLDQEEKEEQRKRLAKQQAAKRAKEMAMSDIGNVATTRKIKRNVISDDEFNFTAAKAESKAQLAAKAATDGAPTRIIGDLPKDGKWDKWFTNLPDDPPGLFIHAVGNIGKNVYVLLTYTNKTDQAQFVQNIYGTVKKAGGDKIDDQSTDYAWYYQSDNFKPDMNDITDTKGTGIRDVNKWIQPGESVQFVYGKQCGNDKDAEHAKRAEVQLVLRDDPANPLYTDGPLSPTTGE